MAFYDRAVVVCMCTDHTRQLAVSAMAYAGSRMSRSRSNICLLSGNKQRVEASGAVIIHHRATLMRWPFFLEIPRSLVFFLNPKEAGQVEPAA